MNIKEIKFLNLENKNSNFNISKQIYFENYKSNKNFSPTLNQFLVSCFLTFLSLIGILISRLRGLTKAHYFIIPLQAKFPYIDKRSQEIFKLINRNKTFNLVKSVSFKNSFKFFFLYPNTIFLYSILDIILFFNYKHSVNKETNFLRFHQCNKKYKFILKKIFKFLGIKKFITIDDHRLSCLFQEICENLKITSIGYMHGKFNKYQIGLRLNTFDNYIIWDDFFKKQLLNINKSYKSKKILFYPHHSLKKKNLKKIDKNKRKSQINILYIYEEKINFKKIFSFLRKLSNEKKINLSIKLRNNSFLNKNLIDFAKKNQINLIYENNLKKVFNINYEFLLAHNSTLLYESVFFNVMPVRVISKDLFKYDEICENFFLNLSLKNSNFFNFFNNNKKKYNIEKLKKTIWKYHMTKFPFNNNKKLKNLLIN
jgi:hypothetical protein